MKAEVSMFWSRGRPKLNWMDGAKQALVISVEALRDRAIHMHGCMSTESECMNFDTALLYFPSSVVFLRNKMVVGEEGPGYSGTAMVNYFCCWPCY